MSAQEQLFEEAVGVACLSLIRLEITLRVMENEMNSQRVKKQRVIFQVVLPEEQTPFDDSSFLVFLFLILKLIYWIFKVYCRQ